MKRAQERNPRVVGVVAVVVVAGLIFGALNYRKLPIVTYHRTYAAYFADSGLLATGNIVDVAGVTVGSITSLSLDGPKVKVGFTLTTPVHLGSLTSATVKVLTPIGTEYLAITPAGPGTLVGAIPLSRTSGTQTVISALTDFSSTTQAYNVGQLQKALRTLSGDIAGTSSSVAGAALGGLDQFAGILASRQQALGQILTQGSALATTLSSRSVELAQLLGQGDLVLKVLDASRVQIQQLLAGTTSFSRQLSQLLAADGGPFTSLLGSLQTVSATLAKDSASFGQATKVLAALGTYAADATGSGPFVDASIPTLLLPDTLIASCARPGAYPSSDPATGCRP